MLRRLIDGAVLTILAWFLIMRLDTGQLVLGLAIAAVIVFTGWRIHRLWRKYQRLLHELAAAEAAKLSDGRKEVESAERILRQRRMMHAADMTLSSGFVLGACAVEVLMLGDWRAAAGGVGFWPECGHLARPTLGWKSQTGRPERKRFAFHIIRGRWALRAPEQVRWQASTCLSTWPPSPSA